jgi:aromatic-L-amino-acid decarboxylase
MSDPSEPHHPRPHATPEDAERLRPGRTAEHVPLALDAETFRAVGHRLVDRIAEHLATLPDRPLTRGLSPLEVRERLHASDPLPARGRDASELLAEAAELLIDGSLYNGHPKFFGYITSSPAPIGMLAELLATAVNPNCGAWTLAPVATEIEAQTIRWIAELVGYPDGCGGLLVSGGNMANMVGLFAARAAAGAAHRIRETGLQGPDAPALRVYVSAETHTWIQKAADLSGLGTNAVRWIEVGDDLRLDPRRVRDAIARDRADGLVPMMVVGTAGSVSTGVVDPLPELAAVCRQEQVWFHVDGAYGGFAAAVPGTPADLAGLAEADSVALDPHKWLYSPLEAGCVLVKRPDTLRDAFSYHPPYYHFGVEATNYVDFGPQNSRGFRALKVWLALRQAGREGYVRMMAQDMALSRRLHEKMHEHPEIEALEQALSISTFRYVPEALRATVGREDTEAYLNDLNREIQALMERDGRAFVSNAVTRGRYALRACIVNFNTTLADVDAMPEIVAELGRRVHAG